LEAHKCIRSVDYIKILVTVPRPMHSLAIQIIQFGKGVGLQWSTIIVEDQRYYLLAFRHYWGSVLYGPKRQKYSLWTH